MPVARGRLSAAFAVANDSVVAGSLRNNRPSFEERLPRRSWRTPKYIYKISFPQILRALFAFALPMAGMLHTFFASAPAGYMSAFALVCAAKRVAHLFMGPVGGWAVVAIPP